MTVDPAVLEELNRLRARVPELSGSVLATTDGLVVAHDAHGIEPDGLAALAAAHLALARRFAHAVNHGELRESVVECDRGYITTYTAGPTALLTLVTSGDANLAMVHLEARRCVRRLVRILAIEAKPQPQTRAEIPTQAGPSAPLARRTPMATLPNNARRRQATG
ncbi:roadblock/LC7 domain-containing protein [Paractinoplanes globisporus]|jgi:predicted regulator of Ras-like GTPase activity (Roadblock/LC7/MglB family)|uniref:Roadblock/LC7 domain-containing protein n=1 Tax=Paractinoplanes globisporus TaxID=113565 RepID=A0ABW6WHU5_9ACTN|nr:roadblock/LC7 domain-containing protein [Actinoplanes globisporus]